MIKKILISQPEPSNANSPYYNIARDCEVELVFRPFIKIESVSAKDFRQQKVNLSDYTAVIFTSRVAIDHFFALTKELRFTVSDNMKYFCVTESVALYLQKYIQYRKRKIFFGESGKIDDLIPSIVKHNKDKYLVPLSDVSNDSIAKVLDKNEINHTECCMYRTVNNNFTPEEVKSFDYDMAIFFSPAGLKSLRENFPDMKAEDIKIGAFGTATAKAVTDYGFSLDLEAPTAKYTSMTDALRHYLLCQED